MPDDASVNSSPRPASPVASLPKLNHPASRPATYRFNWEAHRRPGPGSVADTIDSRADAPFLAQAPTQAIELPDASTATLAQQAIPSSWSSSKYGLNAISTILNHPKKKADPPKAHAPVPPYAVANLPRIKRKDFDGYLRAVGPEWDRFQQLSESVRDGPFAQIDPFAPPAPDTPGHTLPSLETVPQVYFTSPFNLGDPTTFSTVTEQTEDSTHRTDVSSESQSSPLLERMSHYADTIELHLIREISNKSASFFAALSNLHDLQTESEQCLTRIHGLRSLLQEVDDKGAKRGLEIIRLRKRLQNLRDVEEGIKVMESAQEMIGVTRSLIAAGEWEEALGVVDELNTAWRHVEEEPSTPPPIDSAFLPSLKEEQEEGEEPEPAPEQEEPRQVSFNLSALNAFSSLPVQLQSLSLQITASLTSDITSAFRTDLELRTENSTETPLSERDQSFRMHLTPLIRGLLRTDGVNSSVQALRTVASEEIRARLRKFVPQLDDEDFYADPDAMSADHLAFCEYLRTKSDPDFRSLVITLFTALLHCLESLQTQYSIFSEILTEERKGCSPELDHSSIQADLSDTLSSASELANSRSSKLLAVRLEQHAALDLPEFNMLFNATWNFVVACEVICKRMVVGLRGTIVGQAKAFLSSFHAKRLSQSAKFVEDETWATVDVSSATQTLADTIVNCAMADQKTFLIGAQQEAVPVSTSKFLKIEGRTYYIVGATAVVLPLIADYIRVIVNLPLLTTDTVSRVVEFLKAFNSRTCQVVLGAGAMKSAGLKNITAKHLALASQTLSVMVALVPYIRETFRRHLTSKQSVILIEFDKLKRDFQEHQNEIHDKLISIMNDRLSIHIKSLGKIDWNAPVESPIPVNEYMESLVKESVMLHKVLTRYLPEPPVEYVMTQVFAAINHRLEEEYSKIELPDDKAKQRLLTDARHLKTKASGLRGISGMGMLEVVVGEMRTLTSPAPPPPPPEPSPPPVAPPTPTKPATPPSSSLSVSPSLPSTVRKNPFVGNRRISGLLSSVSSFGKTDKPVSPQSATFSPEKEKPAFPEDTKSPTEEVVKNGVPGWTAKDVPNTPLPWEEVKAPPRVESNGSATAEDAEEPIAKEGAEEEAREEPEAPALVV